MGTDFKIEHPDRPDHPDHIVLYDGLCRFCNAAAKFIIRCEKSPELAFASLQSATAQKILSQYRMAVESSRSFDSIAFISEDVILTKSRAVFAIAAHLKPPVSWLRVFSILPAFITDFFYDTVAANRYRWLGKTNACTLPTPEIKARFLDD